MIATRLGLALLAGVSLLVGPSAGASSSASEPAPPTSDGIETGAPSGAIRLVSVRPDGRPPEERSSTRASISSDGRYAVFDSQAHLVRGIGWDRFGAYRTYVRDRVTRTTEAVDVRPDGRLGTIGADDWRPGDRDPSISGDGRLVAFQSQADDLVDGDTNDAIDVFVRDLGTDETRLVSVSSGGGPANGTSFDPVISRDGSSVVFASRASNIVPGDTNGWWDVFRTDLASGVTTLVSHTPDGGFPDLFSEEPAVSHDGSIIVFSTRAKDIIDGGYAGDGSNIVVYDVVKDRFTLASRGLDGQRPDEQSNSPAIDEAGTTVVFHSRATNIASGHYEFGEDVFAFDLATEETVLVSRAWDGGRPNGASFGPTISGDKIAFTSNGSNLARDDRNRVGDVFVYDGATGQTALMSRNRRGKAANEGSGGASLSGDGTRLVFTSQATDLLRGSGHTYVYRVYAIRLA